MGKKFDDIDFVSEETFKNFLPKLYKLVREIGSKHKIDIVEYEFLSCEGMFDIIDIHYTNHIKDFDVNVKGSEKLGYKIINADLSETDQQIE